MRILVTGASGFVGRHLTPRLKGLGHEVDAPLSKEMDVMDAPAVARRVDEFKPDTIVHLAAVTKRPSSNADLVRLRDVNVKGAANVAVNSKGCHLIFTSTCHVYGAPEALPVTESHPTLGQGPYAESKIEAELSIVEVAAERATILRLFNLLGPSQGREFAVAGWCWDSCEDKASESIDAQRSIEVGDLSLARDYLDVRDAVEAICRVVDNGRALAGKTLNVCSGQSRSLESLFAMCAPLSIPIVTKTRLRPDDVPKIVGCNDLLRALDWSPRLSIEQSITDMRGWIFSRQSKLL